ncbi:hypothetical protein F5887DRAFT_932499 [Amanita rubescens]|nr:hypothetical protein F5887DRAFT_932499 [Amanita rubescens]
MRSVETNISSPRMGLVRLKNHIFNTYKTSEKLLRTRSHNDSWDLGQIFLAAAQGVNIPNKITASIKAVKEKYGRAITSGVSLQKCISKIHRGIVTIWDIRSLNEFLLSDAFYCQTTAVVNDLNLSNTSTTHRDVIKASRVASEWTKDVYQGRPDHIRCIMGYVVDIILILQAVFQISLEDRGKMTPDDVNGIIYEFICSERKESIHNAIIAFVGDHDLPKSDMMMDKIESLIKETETKKTDTPLAQTRLLPSLLAILRFEVNICEGSEDHR